mgnify:CR=1 FL=1
MNVRRQFLLSLLAASLFPQWGGAQELPTDVRQEIGKFLDTTARKEVSVGRISIDSVAVEGNTLQLFANMNCAYIPFREDNVAEIYQGVSALLPAEFTKYKLQIRTNKRSIEELVPQVLRSKKDKKTKTFNPVASKPLVTDISAPYTPTNGFQNRQATAGTTSRNSTVGNGSVHVSSRPWKTSTPKATYCLSSCRCWKMPVPTCCFPANAIARRQKSS